MGRFVFLRISSRSTREAAGFSKVSTTATPLVPMMKPAFAPDCASFAEGLSIAAQTPEAISWSVKGAGVSAGAATRTKARSANVKRHATTFMRIGVSSMISDRCYPTILNFARRFNVPQPFSGPLPARWRTPDSEGNRGKVEGKDFGPPRADARGARRELEALPQGA